MYLNRSRKNENLYVYVDLTLQFPLTSTINQSLQFSLIKRTLQATGQGTTQTKQQKHQAQKQIK